MSNSLSALARLVRLEHTIFALPFALLGFFWAHGSHLVEWRKLALVLAAMVTARTAAMAFNRLVDLRYDRKNPRTKKWPLVTGEVTVAGAWTLFAVSAAGFFASALFLNETTFLLSPIAFFLVTGYSLTKRFTSMCHIAVGLALACAPVGGWLAVNPTFDPFPWVPFLLAAAVTFWVAGFDVIYACQDALFDRWNKLHSIPAGRGVHRALDIARGFHVAAALALAAVPFVSEAGWLFWVAWAVASVMLVYEHSLVSGGDLSKVDAAFFTVNGVVSIVFCAMVAVDRLLNSVAVVSG